MTLGWLNSTTQGLYIHQRIYYMISMVLRIYNCLIMQRNLFLNNQSMQAISRIMPNNESSIFQEQMKNDLYYKIHVNSPQGQTKQDPNFRKDDSRFEESKEMINKQPFNGQLTGFDINRQIYSDQQIREAFNTIDINKDGLLNHDDISFFLKCMRQAHNKEEVQEMIKMVSNNNEFVALQDFRKIGKGLLIPVGSIKLHEVEAQLKAKKMGNIKQSSLYNYNPHEILQKSQNTHFSYKLYKLEAQNQCLDSQINNVQKHDKIEASSLILRNTIDILSKRSQMMSLSIDNLDHILHKLHHHPQEQIEVKDIVSLFNIPDAKARSIFFDKRNRIQKKRLVLDAILFSRKGTLQRLQYLMLNYSKGENLNYQEWRDILVFMIGIQQKQVIEKKLNTIMKAKKLKINSFFDKYFILDIMNEELSLFDL